MSWKRDKEVYCEKEDRNAFVSIAVVCFVAIIQVLLASSSVGRLKRVMPDTKYILVSLQLLVSIGIVSHKTAIRVPQGLFG